MAGVNGILHVGIPLCGAETTPWWGVACMTIDWPGGLDFNLRIVEGMRVDDARNMIVEEAIKAGAKYIWFIDDDTLPPRHACKKLLRVLQQDPEAMVCAGIYCSKTDLPEPWVWTEPRNGVYWGWKLGDIFDCELIATGCMMIRAELFKHLEKPWFKEVDTIDTEKGEGQRWTDDLYFCDKVRKAGFRIVAHGGVLPIHWDRKTKAAYGIPNGPPGSRPEPRPLGIKDAVEKAQVIYYPEPQAVPA